MCDPFRARPQPRWTAEELDGVRALVEELAGYFVAHGATNNLTLNVDHPDTGPLAVTMQRRDGKTPAEQRDEARAERDTARAALDAAERDVEKYQEYGVVLAEENRALKALSRTPKNLPEVLADMAAALRQETQSAERQWLGLHLLAVAEALHGVALVDSGRLAAGDENPGIAACKASRRAEDTARKGRAALAAELDRERSGHAATTATMERYEASAGVLLRERDTAQRLAGHLRRAALDALLPIDGPSERDHASILNALGRAARDVPQAWEPKP